MSALLNVKQFVRFDEHGNLHVPNKLFVACQAYVQTPFLNDTSSRVATTEWVRAQISGLTGISLSETDPIWIFEKALYYTKVQADARYLQSFTETDPTVPAWAKASVKPSYAYSELTGLPTLFSGSYTDLTNKPTIPTYTLSGLGGQPLDADLTAIAALSGTAGFLKKTAADTWALDNNTYLTSYTETDPIWTAEKTNYALKTYVDTSISNLVASAPAALNTLNELALALGSDANFSTTVATSIGNRVPYTGATANVDLGTNSITLFNITSNNVLIVKNTGSVTGTNGFSSFSGNLANNGFTFAPNNSSYHRFIVPTSSNYDYTFPASSGTIALTSNIPSLTNYVTLDGTQTITGAKTFSAAVTNDSGLKIKFGSSANLTASYLTLSAYGETGSFPDRTILRIGTSDTYFSLIKFRNNTSYTYDSPASSGTLALTSDIPSLTGYVPYTGATTDVDLGTRNLSSGWLFSNGNGGSNSGTINLKIGNTIQTTSGYNTIGAATGQQFVFASVVTGSYNKIAYLNLSALTDSTVRTFALPDVSGTIALTSNLSSYVPTTRTITINGTALNLSEDRAWTITTASTYTLPNASTTVLGGIKVGTNLSIDANGVLSSTTYAVFTGATALANGSSGLVTAPVIADRVKYLKGDGTWGTPTDTDTTYVAFTGSTTLADGAAGLVPKPVIANRLQYLRGDGTWATPPDTDTDTNTVTQIRRENADGTTSATAYRTGDIRLRQGANVTITEVSAGIFQIASSYVDTDTNTWNANTKTVAGYVAAPGDVANKVWKTDATGNPGWRDDADTDTNTTYSAGTGLTLTGTSFSVTKTITAVETADTIALRNGSGQLVATGFYQASSRELKTNINPFTRSALDIIRDVTVVSFNYKTDVINKHIGFIAEDTPEELSTRNKNVMDANNTIGVLLKAVQELEARIKQLESK